MMRNLCLLIFCCFLTSCHNNTGNNAPGKDEPDLTALTTKKFMLDRGPGALRYLDSLYRAQKNKTPYIQAGRYMSLAMYSIDNSQAEKAITYVDSAIAIIDKQDLTRSRLEKLLFCGTRFKRQPLFCQRKLCRGHRQFF